MLLYPVAGPVMHTTLTYCSLQPSKYTMLWPAARLQEWQNV